VGLGEARETDDVGEEQGRDLAFAAGLTRGPTGSGLWLDRRSSRGPGDRLTAATAEARIGLQLRAARGTGCDYGRAAARAEASIVRQ
jgi:hypothetical protein